MTPTTVVTEGRARLEVPEPAERAPGATSAKGPGKVEGGLFFNPAMRFNRDLSVLVLEARGDARPVDRPYRVFDGLAATGSRSIRLALECRPEHRTVQVHANDRDPGAVALLRRNVETNQVDDAVRITEDDFVHAISADRYDHVDVDPYGSPVPFMDAALQHVSNHGTVALTATDVTALCGVYPKVARRRYDARPWHGPGMHEVALRILAGSAVRTAARHDLALRPILAHATDHYVRVYLEARRGATRADEALRSIGHAVEDADGTRRCITGDARLPSGIARLAGPLWTGPLQEPTLIDDLRTRLDRHPQLDKPPLERFLGRARDEADAPPLHYEMGETAKRLKTSAPPMAALFDALREAGYEAYRTHVADDAFKTDAPGTEIHRLFRAAGH